MEAAALCPENKRRGLCPVPSRMFHRRITVRSHDPYTPPLQVFDHSVEVRDLGDLYVLDRTRRRFRHRLGQADRSSLWNDHTIGSGAFRASKNSAQVSRILDTVKQHDQGRMIRRRIEDLVDVDVIRRRAEGNNALMVCIAGEFVELVALHSVDSDAVRAREIENLVQPLFAYAVGDDDSIYSSGPRTKYLEHRQHSERRVVAKRTSLVVLPRTKFLCRGCRRLIVPRASI